MFTSSNTDGRTRDALDGQAGSSTSQRPELLHHEAAFDLYRVHEPVGGEPRLLKVLVAEQAGSAAAQLGHEHALKDSLDAAWAVQPLALVRWEGRPALLLADPGGVPLDGLLGQPMPAGQFLSLACALAASLARVHERGLVHKDIKPANALVELHTGVVHWMGFGIATHLPREHQPLAPPERIAGTLAYMAPEQTGRMNRSIDSRSDLYALGVSMYQMLTGRLPFDSADPMELFHCHMAREPGAPAERVPGVPALLSAIVMKLLAKAAEDRYQMASGLEADLRRCLAQWQAQGRIDAFALGEHDLSAQLRVPEKLYGREAEIELLSAAFDRVAVRGEPECVLVSGYSGIGKSSVVKELHKVLFPRHGLFAAGKFDQYKRDIPYATLAQAFRGLVHQILGESEVQVRQWREALLAALGPNAALMVKLIAELEWVIGPQPPAQDMPLQETQNRFQTVLRRFVGVFARPEHPLVLFLDDLQWLDTATLQMLEHLLAEPGLSHLLLIGAYRSNEVDASHPLMHTLRAIRRAQVVPVHEIMLAPLAPDDVGRIVADALHCTREHAQGLAALVHEKTGGNPFFTIQFLNMLAEEQLLVAAPEQGGWTWDLGRIRAKGLTDNVVDLMVDKLNRLPAAAQGVLRRLGCLGNSAPVAWLSELHGVPEPQVHEALWEAVRAGLVYRSEGGYTFLHDRIQQAACSLVPESERAAEHLRIGRWLASRTPPAEVEDKIFEIVNQFEHNLEGVTSMQERLQVAEFHLIAGRRAKESTAFAAASKYLRAGSALLPSDHWQSQHGLSFALELNLADCEYLTGDLAAAEERLLRLSARAAHCVELAAVTCARINLFTTLGRSDRAVEAGLEYLRQVGLRWSPHPGESEVRREFDRIWEQLGERAIEELVDLPLMSDGDSRATMDVLMTLLPPTLFTDENLAGLIVGHMANISLRHGHSDGSCIGYAWLGMFTGPRFGNYQAGYRFGKLGLALVDQRGLDRYKSRVYVHFGNVVIPWTHPFHTGLPWVRRAFDTANENGDLTFAAYSCNHLITNLLATGTPLVEVEREAEIGLDFVRKARFGLVEDIITGQLQLVRMLRGETAREASFDDAGFSEAQFERHLQADPRLAIASCWYWIRKLQARVIAGDCKGAVQAALEAERLLWTSPSHVEIAEFHFYAALARAAHGREDAAQEGESQDLGALAGHVRQLEEWARNCPENFGNRVALVHGEVARLEGRDLEAMRRYEEAIQSARENGFIHNQALAHEVAAKFFLARGSSTAGEAHLHAARDCYARWGADGKVRQLQAEHAQLQPRQQDEASAPLAQLDFLTVAKASQAISRRIVLEELIDTLMRIVLENAGARTACLLLARGEALMLAAEASVDERQAMQVVLHLGKNLPQPALPETLINFVRRSQAPVLLADAGQSNPYAGEACWAVRPAKSVLCLPILRQSTLLGVLYLENNLVTHAFVPQRVAVLELLATQAAISLENALLYEDLQRENAKRREVEKSLREREGRIRRLVEANIIGVFFWNMSGEISEANDAFLNMIGYDRQALRSGQVHWREMTPPEYRAVDERATTELRQFGRCTPYEKEYIRKDGQRVPVLLAGAFLEGSQDHGVAYVLDLSERRQAEAEREARRVADAANLAKSNFLATMSHEIRTPMNAIIGMSYLALQSNLDPQQQKYIQSVHRSAELLLSIINDILDFSKIEAGKLEMERIEFDLGDVMDNLVNLIGMKAEEKGLELLLSQPPDLPTALVGDPSRLGQVLLNLITNAIKFTDQGEIVIAIEVLSQEAGSVELCFEVRDTGIGMNAEQQQRLFEPFSQGDSSVSRRYGGTGLGLAISRRLAHLMGGDIRVDSRLGQGSSFRFTATFGLQAQRAQMEGAHAEVRPDELQGARLLVIDDNASAREILVGMARMLGLRGDSASDGEEGLQIIAHEDARGHPYDLVLIDWKMPGMDGVTCVRMLAQATHWRHAPAVLMFTGHGREALAQRLAEQNVQVSALLGKPVTPSSLHDACRTALGRTASRKTRGAQREATQQAHEARLRGTRVLVVEDNPINQEVARELLELADIEVTMVGDGQQAIDILAHQHFDAVLMDCQMPVMDGYSAARALRQQAQHKDLPIIAMTANAMVGDRDRALQAGMNDYIDKPIDVDELFATLARWIRPEGGTPQ